MKKIYGCLKINFIKSIGIITLMLSLFSCAYKQRWTPEMVAPPSSLSAALEKANQSIAEENADLKTNQESEMQLSRDGAILTALARNRSLAVERFSPDISQTYVPEALAKFDPTIFSTTSFGKSSQISTMSEDPSVTRNFQSNIEISEHLPTGTEVFLSGGFSKSRTDSSDAQYQGSWSVGINQALLRGAGTKVNLIELKRAKNSVAISQHALRDSVINLVQQVEDAYWNLVLANETLKIRQSAVKLAEEQLTLNKDFIDVGKLSKDNLISAQAEVASRKADLVDAEADVKAQNIELIQLLNPEEESQWSIIFIPKDLPEIEKVDLEPDLSTKLSKLYRPDLAQARLDLANNDLEVIQTKNGLLPKLDAFANYGRTSIGNSYGGATEYLDDNEAGSYEVGINFEMAPFNRAERAAHRRALFQQKQAEAAVYNLEQQIETEVRKAVIEAQRQWERIPATLEELKSREEESEVEQSRFKVGKSTTLDVLQVQQDFIQAQLDEVSARINYIKSLTALYQSEGTLLDRRGVGTENK